MGLWRLLGGEVNWERVARMQDRGLATEIHGAIIHALGGGTSINIPLSIDRRNNDDKNNVMWVLEKFGRQVPDLKRYPFLSKSYLDPCEDLKQKHSLENQKDWDQAWEWYDEYKKGAIPFLEYRIKIREKELEDSKTDYENYKKMTKLKRWQKGWVNYYEDIKIEIAKLKRELESLKAKEMQKQQEIKPDLTLENENLRLKKEILEMELKLKGLTTEISHSQYKKVFSEATKSNFDLKDDLIEKELYKDQTEYEKWKNIWEIQNK